MNTNINKFKDEFRLVCTDTWGNALDAWFECAGRMNKRNLEIPKIWEYSPGMSDGTDKDRYFFTYFAKLSNKKLIEIGNFLFRYCQYLKSKGIDY